MTDFMKDKQGAPNVVESTWEVPPARAVNPRSPRIEAQTRSGN